MLSKADLLAPAELDRALHYVADHIRSDLTLALPVHPVSIKAGCGGLLEKWLDTEILPLYDRHAELARQSLNRKIGALRLGVEAALEARLKRSLSGGHSSATLDASRLRDLETQLRTAAGAIAQARTECLDATDRLRGCADGFIKAAAGNLIDAWGPGARAASEGLIQSKLEEAAAERTTQISSAIREAAGNAASVLAKTGAALGLEDSSEPGRTAGRVEGYAALRFGHSRYPDWPERGGLAVGAPVGVRRGATTDSISSRYADRRCPRDPRARAPVLGAQNFRRIAGRL